MKLSGCSTRALGAEGANGSSERDTLGVILPNTIILVI